MPNTQLFNAQFNLLIQTRGQTFDLARGLPFPRSHL